MKILGLIPARGGSKGISQKNSKKLGGKPLLQYTIEAALNSSVLDRVIFSSEDADLIELAKSFGVEVPFVRPLHLSEDQSSSLSVVKHALNTMTELGDSFDAVCLLQVTTPFRSASDIDAAVGKFILEGNDALISVQKVPHQFNPHWVFEESNNGLLKIATGDEEIIKRRQELPPCYIRDGSIYITKSDVILKDHSLFGSSLSYIESDPNRFINIDTKEDWEKASEMVKSIE